MGKYLVVMAGKNSKKVNDKQTKKEKEKKKKWNLQKIEHEKPLEPLIKSV